ncbi:uncharacterized protein BO80DRAFT_443389 [Aspergillus ibericus CBS 121593]|uniref:Uncharacterized protein n=1 Tax=Aspergillus ibericus CBS 121593 TaxID=1448316 RepID=A0A395H4M1_9EURO|nr:hypothetical protein BO80DRAFT_443389 [Aspergillus ibericus CBS 121593]RAL02590.1 hypothetical protein BO80DRAFT_443389 [Aspergillus ibericus CBS 121593]
MSHFARLSRTLPLLLDVLPKREVLKLRLVCRATNECIHKYLYGGWDSVTEPLEINSVAWQVHQQLCRDRTFGHLVTEAMNFKGPEWALGYLKQPYAWAKTDNTSFPVVMAAWLRLVDTVELWSLAGNSLRDVRHELLGDLVYAAAYHDDSSLMRLLTERRMDLMSTEGYFGDAFTLAAYRGSFKVIPIILKTYVGYWVTLLRRISHQSS